MKYSRTYHLPYSLEISKDDKRLDNDDYFLNKEIIISSKLDGSNFCMTSKECFARSHSGPPKHASFDWAKSFHNNIKYLIDDNLLIFSEYIFAKHSIYYENLPHYIFIFNILDAKTNTWLSWDEVVQISKILNVPTVPVLFRSSIENSAQLKKMCYDFLKQKEFNINEREGVVIRIADGFHNENFSKSISKMVRLGHVQTSEHWKDQKIIKNKLKEL